MSKLPAGTGWLWLKGGFALFRRQPGILTMLLFANLMISILVSTIPLVGSALALVLIPSLSMAVLQGCFLIEQGQRVAPHVFLTGFQQPAVRALCRLGLVYAAVLLVPSVVARLAIDPAFWEQLANQVDPKTPPAVNSNDLLIWFGTSLTTSLALLVLYFAAPLTYWKKMPTLKACFYSVFAVWGAIKPMIVMLLAWFGIFLGVTIAVAMLLGSSNAARVVIFWAGMLFVLVLQCAFYAAYRQIFGDPADPAEPPK